MANYKLNYTGAQIDEAIGLAFEQQETKANIDGAYENMTVGNAEQLVSSVVIEDKVPYNFRTSGGSADIGNRMTDKVIGGTIAWNQIVSISASAMGEVNGITFVKNADNSIRVYGTATSQVQKSISSDFYVYANHKYYISGLGDGGADKWDTRIGSAATFVQNFTYDKGAILSCIGTSGSVATKFTITVRNGATIDKTFYPQCIDLTQMFGSTIADYIYGLEQSNAGAGVSWFKKLFPKDYYAYNAGTLMSVKTSKHITVGFNAYDNSTGTAKLVGGMQYQITGTYTALSYSTGETITPDASGYFTPAATGELSVTGGNATDTCVHLVWDGERDGEYEPYVKHEYALDDSLELRGIPKLDANDKLYYDGDEYESDGKVTRKYGIVDLGTLSEWNYNATGLWFSSNSLASLIKAPSNAGIANAIISKDYDVVSRSTLGADTTDKRIAISDSGNVLIRDVSYSDSETFKAAMSGVYLVYELETPTEETADPFTNPQIVDDFGTEEYVDYAEAAGTRDVSIPVGHDTLYQSNLRAKIEMAPDSPDGDGDYVVRQENGNNTYVPYVSPIPAAPAEDGTYVLKATVTSGEATLSWEAQA